MAETVIEKILSTGSPLAILVVIVWLFLRFLENEGKANRALFQSINEQNLMARKDTERALADNAQSTRENTAQLQASATQTGVALRAVENAILKFSNHK